MGSWRKPAGAVGIALTIAVSSACTRDKKPEQEPPLAPLKTRVERGAFPTYLTRGARGDRVWKTARAFYKQNGYRAVWTEPDSSGDHRKPRPHTDELIAALQAADREGLSPEDYRASELAQLRDTLWNRDARKQVDERRLAEADLMLTCMFLEYAADLASGRVDPRTIDRQWAEKPRALDFSSALTRALGGEGITKVLAGVAPKHREYLALRTVLSTYRDIHAKGGWPAVPARLTLKPGSSHPAAPVIRKRLAITGDFGPNSADVLDDARPQFDEPMARAIANFQTRHGLNSTGVFTPETAAVMNVPVEHRMQQIALNLERWRWLPDELGDPHLRVNLPAFKLEIFEGSRIAMTQRIVVGKTDSPTPIFSDRMEYVVFSPYWNIPEQIVRDETIPAAMTDPGFLARNNIDVIGTSGEVLDPASIDWTNAASDTSIRFRQRPGADNSLGLVKFIFPNHFNVYLHDTPADALFKKVERDFSHGCMRVEQPLELAQYVLRDQPQWTVERITAAMHARKEQTVKLTRPIPVHVVYFTVIPYENGAVQFREDLYGYDAVQARLTGTRPPARAVQAS